MRLSLLAFTALVSWSQTPPVQSEKLRQALPAVEQWLGAPLVIYDETLLVPQPGPNEASIWNHAIYVPLFRLRSFRTPAEAATFLSHAAAHYKLNHAELYAEKVRLFEMMAVLSPHFPQATMEVNLRANLEKEADAAAAEFLAKSTPRLLQRLMDAVR